MLGYRSLKHPEPPRNPADNARYWRESGQWWGDWEHNFILSLKLWLGVVLIAVAVIIIIAVLH
jgi:hypothetical protein